MLTSMVNHEVILRKVTKLKEYVNELRRADDISWEEYERSIRDRAFVERYIHLAIQTVFDIANHIISYQGWWTGQRKKLSLRTDCFLCSHFDSSRMSVLL